MEWNTETWKATELPNATMPIAESRDGKWLVMGLYDLKDRRIGPQAKLALLKPGETKPERMIESADAIQPAVSHDRPIASAATFDRSDKYIAWLDSSGQLWLSGVQDESKKPTMLDDLKLQLPTPGWSFPRGRAALKFTDEGRLVLAMTYDAGNRGPSGVTWKIDFDAGKAERVEEKLSPVKRGPIHELPRREPLKAMSPDEKFSAIASETEIEIVDQATGGVIKKLSGTLKPK
jgi:hypothetical protein